MDQNDQVSLKFLPDQAGEEEGVDAGIETFRDSPIASLGREGGQNSNDAGREESSIRREPVLMRFDLLETSDYPPRDQHLRAVRDCLRRAELGTQERETDFLRRAAKVLGSDKLKILRVWDENTTGLIGPSRAGTPFHSLVKGAGISTKESLTSGGSFGIGKKAAFAASELQTVFYSTIYQQGAEKKFLAQGKTILISHDDPNGQHMRASGYWGLPGYEPITDPASVPEWLRRDTVGTSVCVVGFRVEEDWDHRIAASLIQNFFHAIYHGKIRFLINDGKVDINKHTLHGLFENRQIRAAADRGNHREEFDFAQHLLRCVTSPSVSEELKIEGLGTVLLTILISEGLPKRVKIIRNGMAITDSLEAFGDRLANFPRYSDFVALVDPIDPEGSRLIKQLENPRHDALSAQRLSDPNKRAAAERTMKQLAKAIRDTIRMHTLRAPEKEVVLEELSKLFPDMEPTDRPQQPGTEDNPERHTFVVNPRRRPRPQQVRVLKTNQKGTAGGAGGGGGSGGGGEGGVGPGRGGGSGGTGSKGGVPSVEVEQFRAAAVSPGSGWDRRLFFTPAQTCRATLRLRATGLQEDEPVMIRKADSGVAKDGVLQIDLTAGERVVLNVKFTEPYLGPLEIAAEDVRGMVS